LRKQVKYYVHFGTIHFLLHTKKRPFLSVFIVLI